MVIGSHILVGFSWLLLSKNGIIVWHYCTCALSIITTRLDLHLLRWLSICTICKRYPLAWTRGQFHLLINVWRLSRATNPELSETQRSEISRYLWWSCRAISSRRGEDHDMTMDRNYLDSPYLSCVPSSSVISPHYVHSLPVMHRPVLCVLTCLQLILICILPCYNHRYPRAYILQGSWLNNTHS